MRWTCGDESVENFEDFSEATQKHILDNIAKALSETLSDQYGCKITYRFHSYEEMIDILVNVMLEAEKIYGAGNYEAKLAYAEKFIEKRNFNLKSYKLKEIVDAALKKIEQDKVKEEEPLILEVSD